MSAKNSKNGRLEQRPAFPFYPQDFLASPKVRRMSMTERGVYITLLCDDWLEGGLPDDLDELADRCGMDVVDFARVWAGPVGRCFPGGADGRCRNPRLQREREHADAQAELQRLKAEFSWARRRGEVPKGAAFEDWCQAKAVQCTGNAPATPGEACAKPGNAPNPSQPNPAQPNPVVPARKRAAPPGDHAAVIAHWVETWKSVRGSDYAVHGAKDGALFKKALKLAGDAGAEEVCRRIDRLFSGDDAWLVENASPGLLVSRWSNLDGFQAPRLTEAQKRSRANDRALDALFDSETPRDAAIEPTRKAIQ